NNSAGVRVIPDLLHGVANLVNGLAVPGFPAAPLLAVYRPQVAILIGPLIPYAYAVLLQVTGIGIPLQEPQQLVNNGFHVQLFGSDQREALLQIKPQLAAEAADGARARAVCFHSPVIQYML